MTFWLPGLNLRLSVPGPDAIWRGRVGWRLTGLNEKGLAGGSCRVSMAGAAVSIAADAAFHVIPYDTRQFDPSSWFDLVNFRYTPQIPGIYRISANMRWKTAFVADKRVFLAVYKNAAIYSYLSVFYSHAKDDWGVSGTDLVDFNGSTDYVDIRVRQDDTAARSIQEGKNHTFFTAQLLGRYGIG